MELILFHKSYIIRSRILWLIDHVQKLLKTTPSYRNGRFSDKRYQPVSKNTDFTAIFFLFFFKENTDFGHIFWLFISINRANGSKRKQYGYFIVSARPCTWKFGNPMKIENRSNDLVFGSRPNRDFGDSWLCSYPNKFCHRICLNALKIWTGHRHANACHCR